MNHLEIEFKTMLTKEEHDRLLQFFADISPISQTNKVSDTHTWLFEYELLTVAKLS